MQKKGLGKAQGFKAFALKLFVTSVIELLWFMFL
jgi:hypothetical protein